MLLFGQGRVDLVSRLGGRDVAWRLGRLFLSFLLLGQDGVEFGQNLLLERVGLGHVLVLELLSLEETVLDLLLDVGEGP